MAECRSAISAPMGVVANSDAAASDDAELATAPRMYWKLAFATGPYAPASRDAAAELNCTAHTATYGNSAVSRCQ